MQMYALRRLSRLNPLNLSAENSSYFVQQLANLVDKRICVKDAQFTKISNDCLQVLEQTENILKQVSFDEGLCIGNSTGREA